MISFPQPELTCSNPTMETLNLNLIKPAMKLTKFQEKSLLLQTNDVQAMLLQSERVLEMNFPAIWRPKLQTLLLWCPPRELLMEIVD